MTVTQIIITDDTELDGPDPDDETRVIYVFAAGDDGDAIGRVKTMHDAPSAIEFARAWARRLHVAFSWE